MSEKTKTKLEENEELESKKTTAKASDKQEIASEDTDVVAEEDSIDLSKSDRYYEAVGRRRSATARVRIYTKGSGIVINEKEHNEYFVLDSLVDTIEAPLKKMKSIEKFRVSVKVTGGGMKGQSEAIRHGIARALVVFNADFKKRLKRSGYLKRDPRVKERKKYGLKKARKAPRWAKR